MNKNCNCKRKFYINQVAKLRETNEDLEKQVAELSKKLEMQNVSYIYF